MKIRLQTINLLGISLILITSAFLVLLPAAQKTINYTVSSLLTELGGEKEPSGKIIIVHITEEDVQNLGGSWPLKRSYYALLIKRLRELNAGAIGFEIFLSPYTSSQSIYNEILLAEIKKEKDKLVFSSLLENAHNIGKEIYADSAERPFPSYPLPEIATGHLNYYDDYGFYIPGKAKLNKGTENSFYRAILQKAGISADTSIIKLNINSSWKKFKNYSFIEFIRHSETKEAREEFSGKIILFGVSDHKIAKTFTAPFNGELPGIALHAFAVNNVLTSSSIIVDNFVSATVFILFVIALTFLKKRKIFLFGGAIAIFIVISFLLHYFGNVELNYSFFIVPVVIQMVNDAVIYAVAHKKKVETIEAESAKMKEELTVKQAALAKLQSELNLSPEEGQSEIIKKISELKSEIQNLKEAEEDKQPAINEMTETPSNFHGIIYKSRKMASIIEFVKKVAPEDASILIYGESGVGKELFARAVHELSPRKDKSFVAVNCAALTETLLESELFGHVKGAFTNAVADKTGRFEAADKGTIFLDEIGETNENFQTKLLRILQSGTFEKVGSSKTQSVNVRVVAATNKKLEKLIEEKKFREDLYYRLNVIKLEIPPLRDRKEDIELLVRAFLPDNLTASKSVLERLMIYDWKGNVRELESVVKRAAILAKAESREMIQLKDLPKEIADIKKENLYELILDSLREKKFSHSSMTETAKELEIGRTAVSENFRGYILKAFYENSFDLERTVLAVSQSEDEETNRKVRSKIENILENLSADISKGNVKDQEEFKKNFPAKYKNMPQAFHFYQDEAVRYFISQRT